MLSIIIVNYKNEERTIKYVKEELVKITIPHIIIVVNNQANKESNTLLVNGLKAELILNIESAINKGSKCFVVSHSDNLGFAKGNNLGVNFCQVHFQINYYLFSNNDIVFINKNVVENLINKLKILRNVALIGPKVVGLDGKNQSPEPFISFWTKHIWMYWLTPFISIKKKQDWFKLDYSQKAEEGVHFKIMGSFFIVKAQDFVACGMMDESTFLYGEELILSERLKRIGKKAYYYPDVKILHEHGLTISKYINIRAKNLKQFESECYYYKTYKNVNNLSIFIARLTMVVYLKFKQLSILKK